MGKVGWCEWCVWGGVMKRKIWSRRISEGDIQHVHVGGCCSIHVHVHGTLSAVT